MTERKLTAFEVEAYEQHRTRLYKAMCAASKRGHRHKAEDIRHQLNELQYRGVQAAAEFYADVIDRALRIVKSNHRPTVKLETLEQLLQKASEA